MLNRVGPFEVLREIGRGGMGVVYLARDNRLDRQVAIKALPEHLALDPERLARFEREAKSLAGLNHPNVAGIYGVEEQSGTRYLVLEYVEGETLADRLDRGPLPVDEAVRYAVQIAAGVEAAHEAGVIHRDLKPENIKITPDDVAKVLDFGLARNVATAPAASDEDKALKTTAPPKRASMATVEGAVLGTAAYMSPEQARGKRVDKRTDIWSFGVVLFELLTGASPFAGETVGDSIGAVLYKDFDFEPLPASTPANVRRVLARCLERDRDERYRDIGDVRLDLLRPEGATLGQHRTSSPRSMIAVGLAGLLLAALVGVATWFAAKPPPGEHDERVRRLDVIRLDQQDLPWLAKPAISPDGTRIAYIRNRQVHVRSLVAFETSPVPGTEGAEEVFWSPDSQDLGFAKADGVYRYFGQDSRAERIADFRPQYSQEWTKDGRVIASTDGGEYAGLVAVPEFGGKPVAVRKPDPAVTIDYHDVVVIPDTDVLVFVEHLRGKDSRQGSHAHDGDDGPTAHGLTPLVASDGSRSVKIVEFDDTFMARLAWSPTGHVLFTRGNAKRDLWAVPFSSERLECTGDPFLVMPDADNPSVANDGTLVVLRRTGDAHLQGNQLGWMSPEGIFEAITENGSALAFPMPSPDGSMMAFAADISEAAASILIHDFARGFNRRLPTGDGVNVPIAWSPDGTELMAMHFNPSRELLVQTRFHAADGSGETREPISGLISGVDPTWTTAAKIEISVANRGTPGPSVIRLDDPAKTIRVLEKVRELPQFGFMQMITTAISPDGAHMLYASKVTGRREIYCVEWPSGEGLQQVSINGGSNAIWSRDGSRILFTGEPPGTGHFQVDVARKPSISFSTPRPLFDEEIDDSNYRAFTPSHDGKRFVTVRLANKEETRDPYFISLIENWYEPFRVAETR